MSDNIRTLEDDIILAIALECTQFDLVEGHLRGYPSSEIRQELWRLIQKGTILKDSQHTLSLAPGTQVPMVFVPSLGWLNSTQLKDIKAWAPIDEARKEELRKIRYFDLIVEACREHNEAVNPVLETGVAVRDLIRKYSGPEETSDGV